MPTSRKKFLQQTGFALAGSILPLSKLFAGSNKKNRLILDEYHPKDCNVDLTTHYHYTYLSNGSGQIGITEGYYSKSNPPDNAVNQYDIDVQYEKEGNAPNDVSDCNPSQNDCRNTDFDPYNIIQPQIGKNPFRYKVYYPKPDVHNYTTTPLPCIIFFHAGGFQECPDLDLPVIRTLCIELSRKGFICFTIEYRRGRIKDLDLTKTSVQQQLARYRAIQDGCGAIRSIIKKNRLGEFSFKIDENQVFLGGASAGSMISMACAYYRTSLDLVSDQAMIDAVYQKATGSAYNIKQALGKMHVDYYYAAPNSQYWPIIRGVASLWGGIVIPKIFDGASASQEYEEYQFFDSDLTWANPPFIAFHGDDDTTIPFFDDSEQDIDLSPFVFNAETDYNAESFCTLNNFTQKATAGAELKLCSTLNMFLIMKELNRFSELYVDCTMEHGLDKSCAVCDEPGVLKSKDLENNCIPCNFDSNFGLFTAQTSDPVEQYMAQRIAVFFQTIMSEFDPDDTNAQPLPFGFKGRPYFKECKNNRRCNQTNNNECSPGYKLCNNNLLDLE